MPEPPGFWISMDSLGGKRGTGFGVSGLGELFVYLGLGVARLSMKGIWYGSHVWAIPGKRKPHH